MDDTKTLKKAQAEVFALGLPLPTEPDKSRGEVNWPRNVADLSAEELALHMTWWTGWSAFAGYQLARAETNEAAYKKRLAVETQIRIHKSVGDYRSVTELKASVAQMPDIKALEAKVLEASATKRLLKALLEGYDEKKSTVSREITRRSSEV